jgi:CxxC-x17-CxxC domain-containing protein
MGRFDRGNSRGGFNAGRGRDRGFSRDRPQRREMFDVKCSECGRDAQVPFKPTGNKPVLCSDCFSKTDRPNGSSRQSPSGNSEDLKQINAKLDKIIAILQDLELETEEFDEETEEEKN